MERLSEGLVTYAGHLWAAGKSRKGGVCWKTGKPFGKGETVYRPVTNGYDRMNRIRAEFFNSATPQAAPASPAERPDPPRETSKSNTFSTEQKERAFDLIKPDHGTALEIEEIDELRRRHRMTSKSNGKPEGGK